MARFCRTCGKRLEQARDAEAPAVGPAASEPRGAAAPAPAVAASLTLRRLVQLPRWPERFVNDVLELLPSLSAEQQNTLEQACWTHTDAMLSSRDRGDFAELERELTEMARAGALPWLAIEPELLAELRRQAE